MTQPTREQKRRQYRKALEELETDLKDPRHGTHTGYLYGCRCDRCIEGNRLYMDEWRARNKEGAQPEMSQKMRHFMTMAKPREVYIHNVGWVKI